MTSEARDRADGDEAGTDRRTFIKRATLATAGLSASGLLAACGSTSPVSSGSTGNLGPGGLPLARPNHPLTLPIYPDNKAIASGLKPEKGPLQLYNFTSYINQKVINDFEKKYNVSVQVTVFDSIEAAIPKLASKQVEFDVFWTTTSYIEQLVAGKLVQPINHSYIPNLAQNVWTSLQSPYYDQGSRYSVPYSVYTTGIGWRSDHLPGFDPDKLANPWNALWQVGPTIKGRVGIEDEERDGIAMGLLRNGITDINTGSPRDLKIAENSLIQLVKATNLKIDLIPFQFLGEGELWLHEAYSGDMLSAPSYATNKAAADALRFWWPASGNGPINNDMMTILNGGKNPVLAHLFLNHMLDTPQVFENFAYTSYQAPINAMTPEVMVQKGLVPPNLKSAIIYRNEFDHGYPEAPLSENAQVLWQNAWAAIKSA
jgi:spermidine/putrescine transport system substrate-binding protein